MSLEVLKKYRISIVFVIATCFIMVLWNYSKGNGIADFFIDYNLFVLLGVLICAVFLLLYFLLKLINGQIKFYYFLLNAFLVITAGLAMFLFFIREVRLHC